MKKRKIKIQSPVKPGSRTPEQIKEAVIKVFGKNGLNKTKLPKSYDTIVNPVEIIDFIEDNSYFTVLDFMETLPKYITKYLGVSTLTLELRTDPEEGDKNIFVYVKSNLPNDITFDRYLIFLDWFVVEFRSYPQVLNVSPMYN